MKRKVILANNIHWAGVTSTYSKTKLFTEDRDSILFLALFWRVFFPFDFALALAFEDLGTHFGLLLFGGLVPGADLSDLQAEAEGGQSWSKQTKTMVAPISPPYIIFVFYMQNWEVKEQTWIWQQDCSMPRPSLSAGGTCEEDLWISLASHKNSILLQKKFSMYGNNMGECFRSSSPSHEGAAFLATVLAWIVSNSSYIHSLYSLHLGGYIGLQPETAETKLEGGIQGFNDFIACKMICKFKYTYLTDLWGLRVWLLSLMSTNFAQFLLVDNGVHQHFRRGFYSQRLSLNH